MLNLGPCSMLPPHLHPRATNYVVAVHGNTTTYMYEENGARLVTQVLTPGHATVFPQGSMHMMMNTGESPSHAVLVTESHAIDLYLFSR
jgi:oxalate decarboxylase/phosphoglucose isomerase-like protein (cupin superfamily)